MKLLILLAFYSAITFSLCAQMPVVNSDGSISIEKNNAKFTLTPFGRSVIKVTMLPNSYKSNEAISDAVMAKPVKSAVKVASATNADYVVSLGTIKLTARGDTFYFGKNGDAVIAETLSDGEFKGFRFLLAQGEKIYGSGERALPLDRRGYKLNLYNGPWYGYGMGADNLNYCVPFITSSNNYALFFDNPSKGYLDIGKTNSNILEYGALSNELNFYLIEGNSNEEILAAYHSLTGTQPMPPRYVMGNFMSRFGYVSESQLTEIKQQMLDAKIPFDAVIIDLFWFGNTVQQTLGNLKWINKKAWPNPTKMIAGLKNEGIKTILITEPFFIDSSLNYKASTKYNAVDSAGKPYLINDFYFGKAGLIDIFRKDSRTWFWSKYKAQMNIGVDNWWGDLGEPEKHPSAAYHNLKDLGFKRMFKADEVHNLYGHYWTKMLYEKYALEYPNKRLFTLNRSGFAGTQRYGIIPWTGDVGRNWSGFQAQMPIILGMSMSGVPYVHSDAGGFSNADKDEELYIRWLQFAQYTPIFRPHGTEIATVDPGLNNFPSEPALHPEPYKSIAKSIVDNRYALLPHNYTLAYQQSITGKPLISPLYYNFPNDTTARNVQDEYMWGGDMLVAPVTEKGASSRNIYLPKGKWYSYSTYTITQGGSWFKAVADMQTIPVFVKEGSFIVTNNTWLANTVKYNTSDITVTYYPSEKYSDYTLYDDDGNTNKSIEKKLFELITFETTGWEKETKITIRSNGGNFAGKPKLRLINLVIPGLQKTPASVSINGKLSTDVSWSENPNLLTIKLSFTGDTKEILVKMAK